MDMKTIFVIALVCIISAVLISGCTQPPTVSQQPITTSAVQQSTIAAAASGGSQVQVTQAGAAKLIAGPTDQVPASNQVLVQVDRNRVATTPTITISFRGGPGMNAVVSMDVTLTRSDGITTTKTLSRPQVGDSVTVDGTTGSDRVEVWINANNGQRYKVYDDVLVFRSASPNL